MSAQSAPARGRRSQGKVTEIKPGASKPVPKTPESPDLRQAPEWLSAPAKLEWSKVVPTLDEMFPETLSAADVPALALMFEHLVIAQAAAKSMRGKDGAPVAVDVDEAHRDRLRKAPSSQVMRDHSKAFLELAREYGGTLRARSGIDLEKLGGVVPDTGDDDDDLFDD